MQSLLCKWHTLQLLAQFSNCKTEKKYHTSRLKRTFIENRRVRGECLDFFSVACVANSSLFPPGILYTLSYIRVNPNLKSCTQYFLKRLLKRKYFKNIHATNNFIHVIHSIIDSVSLATIFIYFPIFSSSNNMRSEMNIVF